MSLLLLLTLIPYLSDMCLCLQNVSTFMPCRHFKFGVFKSKYILTSPNLSLIFSLLPPKMCSSKPETHRLARNPDIVLYPLSQSPASCQTSLLPILAKANALNPPKDPMFRPDSSLSPVNSSQYLQGIVTLNLKWTANRVQDEIRTLNWHLLFHITSPPASACSTATGRTRRSSNSQCWSPPSLLDYHLLFFKAQFKYWSLWEAFLNSFCMIFNFSSLCIHSVLCKLLSENLWYRS